MVFLQANDCFCNETDAPASGVPKVKLCTWIFTRCAVGSSTRKREPDEEELISTCATICNEFGSLSVGRVFDTPCDEEIKDCGLDKFV